jgi:hypothetical protein
VPIRDDRDNVRGTASAPPNSASVRRGWCGVAGPPKAKSEPAQDTPLPLRGDASTLAGECHEIGHLRLRLPAEVGVKGWVVESDLAIGGALR